MAEVPFPLYTKWRHGSKEGRRETQWARRAERVRPPLSVLVIFFFKLESSHRKKQENPMRSYVMATTFRKWNFRTETPRAFVCRVPFFLKPFR